MLHFCNSETSFSFVHFGATITCVGSIFLHFRDVREDIMFPFNSPK